MTDGDDERAVAADLEKIRKEEKLSEKVTMQRFVAAVKEVMKQAHAGVAAFETASLKK